MLFTENLGYTYQDLSTRTVIRGLDASNFNEDTISRRYFDVAFRDVMAAFDLYMRDRNAGRAKVLVVDGYDGSSLPNILDILNTGDYHGAEPWLYSEQLRRNIGMRIRSFHSSKNLLD